jgi:hypothetical protein
MTQDIYIAGVHHSHLSTVPLGLGIGKVLKVGNMDETS